MTPSMPGTKQGLIIEIVVVLLSYYCGMVYVCII